MRIVTDNSGLPAALALLLVFSCTSSANLVQNAPVVEDLPQLRSLLRTAQWMLLPRDTPGVFDLGSYAFTPTNPISGDEWLDLSNGGFDIPLALWIYEDARSADTVFVNVENLRSVTLPPEPGYTPFWVYENALSGLNPGDIPPLECHAPSQVSITPTLRPPSSTLDADDSSQPGDSTPTAQSPETPLKPFAAATPPRTLCRTPRANRRRPLSTSSPPREPPPWWQERRRHLKRRTPARWRKGSLSRRQASMWGATERWTARASFHPFSRPWPKAWRS